jgi:hypothetical protein
MKDVQTAVRGFVEELARRDGAKGVSESTVRGAIGAYVKCLGIVYHGKRELSAAQMDRALRYYRERRSELHRQPLLLAS